MLKKISVLVLIGATALFLSSTGCGKTKEAGASQTIKLHIDHDNESKLQLTVDNGYQLWRLNPIDVAHGALTDSHQMAEYNACRIVQMDEKHALVTTSYNDTTYNVHLARVVKPNGIWTATAIEKIH